MKATVWRAMAAAWVFTAWAAGGQADAAPCTGDGERAIPPLGEILAASEYLSGGDIPEDATTLDGKTPLYVATDGSDDNSGLDTSRPKRHLRAAIRYANEHPAVPCVIYLRGGVHYESAAFDYLEIERGDLVITAYPGEEATLRPEFWPGNPDSWGQQHLFVAVGPYENITISDLTVQGWQEPFYFGSQYEQGPMRNLVIRNVVANEFRKRFEISVPVFFSTEYVTRNFFPGPAAFDPAAAGIKYQIEGLILSNVVVEGAGLAVNIGDERDANVRGLRITQVEIRNDPQAGNNTANDGIAVVNSHRALIDHCLVRNMEGDGIDCKAIDVCVVNSVVEGVARNAVKFWRNGELINSIVHASTPIDDGALVIETGPFRMVNSLVMGKVIGYTGSFGYDLHSGERCEIVNSVFSRLDHPFYVSTEEFTSRNSLFSRMRSGLFSDANEQILAADVAALNTLPGCSGNIAAEPSLASVPGFYNQAVAAGTASMIEVYDRSALGETYAVGDTVEINNDDVPRAVTAVAAGQVQYDATFRVGFAPPLAAATAQLDRCASWGGRSVVEEDFRPLDGSPCIDAGTGEGVLLPSFDHWGAPRVMGAAPDIGPYEYSAAAPRGDADEDGLANIEEDADMDGILEPGETDPGNPDSDGDGMSDLIERRSGSDPRSPASIPVTVRVNFGPASAPAHAGQCPDGGGGFGPRGYGWR